jgi:diketogulonate reductase-like aldo/keto reductase
MKQIPSSGEMTPIIGMGTFRVFQTTNDTALRDQRTQVMKTFLDMGGRMIDSSPMYTPAEELVGYGLEKLGRTSGVIASTKIWNVTAEEGKAQFENSLRLWNRSMIDIYMAHNVVEDWEEHLVVLREYKDEGKIRYLSLTTSHGREHPRLEHVMATQDLDFVQLTYNIVIEPQSNGFCH